MAFGLLTVVLQANRALKQIPFNGKKLKPAKLRKDYWRRMAMIQFPEGLGHVGRSVFHLLREFRMAHELNWGDEVLYHPEKGSTLTKHSRGKRLNDQKANSIADLAAVLGGAGKGNKMWLPVSEGGDSVDTTGQTRGSNETEDLTGLVHTTIFWANEQDRNYAQEWSSNVTHQLFEKANWVPLEEPPENIPAQPPTIKDRVLGTVSRYIPGV